MNTAHRFQHKYTGVQILVWHQNSKEEARKKFCSKVIEDRHWIYLDQVIINTVE